MQKRLFAVRKPNGKLVTKKKGEVLYFGGKMAAKVERDERNKTKAGHSVAAGPDHWRYHDGS